MIQFPEESRISGVLENKVAGETTPKNIITAIFVHD